MHDLHEMQGGAELRIENLGVLRLCRDDVQKGLEIVSKRLREATISHAIYGVVNRDQQIPARFNGLKCCGFSHLRKRTLKRPSQILLISTTP